MLSRHLLLRQEVGILTVPLHVQIAIALAHKAGALALFAMLIQFIHRLRAFR